METTYTRDDIREALKGAGLPDYVRHKVYCNLPAKATPREGRTLLVGGAYDNVSFVDLNGDYYEGTFVVAAASLSPAMVGARQITFWNTAEIASKGSMQGQRTALTANYDSVAINSVPLQEVSESWK